MPEVTITLITSTGVGRISKGEYRYIMICAGAKVEGSGKVEDTTANRLAMTALIEALKRMRKPSVITVITDNGYLIQCRNQLAAWEQNGWMRDKNQEVKNADLWKKISHLQRGHATRYIYNKLMVAKATERHSEHH